MDRMILVAALVSWLAGCAGGGTDVDGAADTGSDPDVADTTDQAGEPDAEDPAGDTALDTEEEDAEDASDVMGEDTLGWPCEGNWDCQDGVYCNGVEYCEGGFCQAGLAVNCNDGHDCTRDECDEASRECTHTPDDTECDDGLACNGEETCTDSLGCQDGTPVDCDDGVLCTLDLCNEPGGTCTNTVDDIVCDDMDPCTVDECDEVTDTCHSTLIDGDGDLFPPASCGGPDCDDADETRHPGADEDCEDGVDSNCNGLPDASDPACCTGSGDTCDCPVDMTGGGLFSGTTTGMTNDYCGSCGASPCTLDGKDVAFYLWLPERSLVQWAFAAMDRTFYFHLHEDSCTGPEVMCESYIYTGESRSRFLDEGFYYFILDAPDFVSAGDYNIAALVTPATDVSGNDTCATAAPVTLDHAYAGYLTGMTDDYDPDYACAYDDGRDAVFRLDLTVGQTLEISTTGSSMDTILFILDDGCADMGICDDNSGGDYMSARIMRWFDPGTYYIVVDEYMWGYGYDDYVLSIHTF